MIGYSHRICEISGKWSGESRGCTGNVFVFILAHTQFSSEIYILGKTHNKAILTLYLDAGYNTIYIYIC